MAVKEPHFVMHGKWMFWISEQVKGKKKKKRKKPTHGYALNSVEIVEIA